MRVAINLLQSIQLTHFKRLITLIQLAKLRNQYLAYHFLGIEAVALSGHLLEAVNAFDHLISGYMLNTLRISINSVQCKIRGVGLLIFRRKTSRGQTSPSPLSPVNINKISHPPQKFSLKLRINTVLIELVRLIDCRVQNDGQNFRILVVW